MVESLPFLDSCLCCCPKREFILSCNYTGERCWEKGIMASLPPIPFLSHVEQRDSDRCIFKEIYLCQHILHQISWLPSSSDSLHWPKFWFWLHGWWCKLEPSPGPLNLREHWSFSPVKSLCTSPVCILPSITITTICTVSSTSIYKSSGKLNTDIKPLLKGYLSVTNPANL